MPCAVQRSKSYVARQKPLMEETIHIVFSYGIAVDYFYHGQHGVERFFVKKCKAFSAIFGRVFPETFDDISNKKSQPVNIAFINVHKTQPIPFEFHGRFHRFHISCAPFQPSQPPLHR